jgi:hypothetical protein
MCARRPASLVRVQSMATQFVIVTDPHRRRALGDAYRTGYERDRSIPTYLGTVDKQTDERKASHQHTARSADYLPENTHRAPALVVSCSDWPCRGRAAGRQDHRVGQRSSRDVVIHARCPAARTRNCVDKHLAYRGAAHRGCPRYTERQGHHGGHCLPSPTPGAPTSSWRYVPNPRRFSAGTTGDPMCPAPDP